MGMCWNGAGKFVAVLDSKLTFTSHVDATMSKSNKMTLTASAAHPKHADAVLPRQARFDHKALLAAYLNAHILSVIEKGSVI